MLEAHTKDNSHYYSTTMLPPPSEEQKTVIRDLLDNRHVSLRALPGTGKSTLIYHIIQSMPTKRVVLLTYNRALADQTKVKLGALIEKGSKTSAKF